MNCWWTLFSNNQAQHADTRRYPAKPEELTGCYVCHTTGYGRPGGFTSFADTPELADAGCEVCHGPGSAHVDSGGDPAKIQAKMEMAGCEACHNAERVRAFNFKPMLFAGAH